MTKIVNIGMTNFVQLHKRKFSKDRISVKVPDPGRNATVTERAAARPDRALWTSSCTLPNGRVSARAANVVHFC